MNIAFLIISACLLFGIVTALSSKAPSLLPTIGKMFSFSGKRDLKSFSPRKTLFIIGPSAKHTACRMQRKLLKPALAALIRDDISVMEIYGEATPRKNGELMKWLDPALLRHAMDAEEGFFIIYVDEDGKTVFKNAAPMVTTDILAQSGLHSKPLPHNGGRKSLVLKKLSAA